jgi:outer membrane protein assembly factor BamA
MGDNSISRRTLLIDARHYTRLAANGVLALRFNGQNSWGRDPDFMYFGGNSELRGYEYLQFIGHKAFFANAELRFPLIEAMLTPFGVLGGLRGVFFAGIGGAGFKGVNFVPWTRSPEAFTPIVGYQQVDIFGTLAPVYGNPIPITGWRLKDARASYGIGLETALLGLPMHFDWSWRTLMNKNWEDALFYLPGAAEGKSGSDWFRTPKFSFWIGYDF